MIRMSRRSEIGKKRGNDRAGKSVNLKWLDITVVPSVKRCRCCSSSFESRQLRYNKLSSKIKILT